MAMAEMAMAEMAMAEMAMEREAETETEKEVAVQKRLALRGPGTQGRWRGWVGAIGAVVMGASQAFALNPIHTAGFASVDREASRADFLLETGGLFRDGDPVHAQIPVALSLGLGRLEFGGALKTQWGHRGDAVTHFTFGGKFRADGNLTLGASLSTPLSDGASPGLMLEALGRNGHGRRLSSLWVARAGFLDGLAYGDALMAMEFSWTPRLTLGRGLSLECGLIGSSQTENFDGHFALDLQPGLQVGLGRSGALFAGIVLGLTGDHSESMAARLGLSFPL